MGPLITVSVSVSGVHVFQEVNGIEWDDETGEVKVFSRFAYDGEDFMEWDPNTFTWIALRPEAVTVKPIWDASNAIEDYYKTTFTQIFPEQLKQSVEYGRSVLLRTGRIT